MNSNDNRDLILELIKRMDDIKDNVHRVELEQAKKFGDIHSVLVQQENNLDIHMKRSDMLEKQVGILEQEVKPVLDSLRSIKILFAVLSIVVTLASIATRFF